MLHLGPRLVGNAVVPAGETLRIEPGVRVYADVDAVFAFTGMPYGFTYDEQERRFVLRDPSTYSTTSSPRAAAG